MRDHKARIIAIEVVEAGKPWAEADGDICEAIDFCEYYGREMIRLDAGGVVQSPPGEANTLRYHARRRRGHCAMELPASDSHRHGYCGLGHGQCVLFKPAGTNATDRVQLVEALGCRRDCPRVLAVLARPTAKRSGWRW